MMLIEQTPLADAALPIDAFKAHLRMGTGFGEDTLQDTVLHSFLRAAITAIEARTDKVLIARSFTYTIAGWRYPNAQPLPVAPVTVVNRLALEARDGTETVLEPAGYWLQQDAQRPRVRSTASSFPALSEAGSAKVTFTAGYGSVWAEVPADLQQAVLLLAAHYYEYRHETSLSEGCMPFGVHSLIERYKAVRLWSGCLE